VFVDSDGKSAAVALNHVLVSDIVSSEKGPLWISPQRGHVAFDLLFFRSGNVPVSRIGVAQLDVKKTVFVGESAYCHYNWGYQAQQRADCKTDPWTHDGGRFAFVSGRGDGEADLYVASADGSQTLRLTEDGDCKWSPVFDTTGRRIAYFAARWGGEGGTLLDTHVRILDIYTGNEQRLAPANTSGWGLVLAWTSDGSELLHDWHRGKSPFYPDREARIYRVNLPKSEPVPSGIAVKAIPPVSMEDQVIAAILSGSGARVCWGIEHAYDVPTIRVREAMCKALPEWFPREYPCAGDMVRALMQFDAREAASVFRQAILIQPEPMQIPVEIPEEFRKKIRPQYQPNAACLAITALMKWNVPASTVDLRRYLERFPNEEPAVYATAALVVFGQEGHWADLAAYARNPDKEIRSRLTKVLSHLHDPRAVEILLELVSDGETLYFDAEGTTQVGDQAADTLKAITGQELGRDAGGWRKWRAEQARTLPMHPK
jgi:hypothetical protein